MFAGCLLDLLKQGNTSAYRFTPRWVHATHALTVLVPLPWGPYSPHPCTASASTVCRLSVGFCNLHCVVPVHVAWPTAETLPNPPGSRTKIQRLQQN
eukprot:850716-Prymnesium_polylepis.1